MNFKLDKDTPACVFSYLQVRDTITVKAGTLIPTNIEYTSWGEEVVTFEGYPPLITATHWGPTPFKQALQEEQ